MNVGATASVPRGDQRQVCLATPRASQRHVPRKCTSEAVPRKCTSASDVSCHLGAGCHLPAAALPRQRGRLAERHRRQSWEEVDTGHLPRHTVPPTGYLLATPLRAYLLPTLSRPPSPHQTEDGKTANTGRPLTPTTHAARSLTPTTHARPLRRTR